MSKILRRNKNLFRLSKKNLKKIILSLAGFLGTRHRIKSCLRKKNLSLKIKRNQKIKKPSKNLFWQNKKNIQSLFLCASAHFLIMKSQRRKEVNLATLLLPKTYRLKVKKLNSKSSSSKKSFLRRPPSLKFFSPSFNILISPWRA